MYLIKYSKCNKTHRFVSSDLFVVVFSNDITQIKKDASVFTGSVSSHQVMLSTQDTIPKCFINARHTQTGNDLILSSCLQE